MEKIFARLSQVSASFVLVVLVATMTTLYLTAKPALEEFGAKFLIDPRWGVEVEVDVDPAAVALLEAENARNIDERATVAEGEEDFVDDDDDDIMVDDDISGSKEVFGGAVAIVGTIFSTIIAMLFAVPLAMGIAIFLAEIAPPVVSRPVGVAIELLAAIPSIIYGMWGLFYFGPFISSVFGGNSVSLLVAGLVLGIMVIPFMAALSRDAINTTPDILKEAAYSVGATKFEVIKDIIFPYAKAGIIGSMIISLGRALGETMAVAFVIGGVFEFASKVTDPTNSIPVVLANNFAESSGMSLSALFYLAMILFVVSFGIIFSAKRYFLKRGAKSL